MGTIGKLSFNACVYHIYKERNQHRFVGKSLRINMIVENIIFDVQSRVCGF